MSKDKSRGRVISDSSSQEVDVSTISSGAGGGTPILPGRVARWEDGEGDRHLVLTLPDRGSGSCEAGEPCDLLLMFRNGLLEDVEGAVETSPDEGRLALWRERQARQKAEQELAALKRQMQDSVLASLFASGDAPQEQRQEGSASRSRSDASALASLWDTAPDVAGMFGTEDESDTEVIGDVRD